MTASDPPRRRFRRHPGRRRATDVFSSTRTFGLHPLDVLPLGARPFAIPDDEVSGGYLWGVAGAPTVLLLHGWGADSSSVHPLVLPLVALGCAVATFDAPGHGVWQGRVSTMSRYVGAATAAWRALPDVAAVVAHSLGSIPAVAAAARVAEDGRRSRCVALVAPTCTLSGVLDRWRPVGFPVTEGLRAGIRAELHRRNGVPVSHWDIGTLGSNLDVPVLVLHDPADDVVPYTEAERVVAALPRASLVDLPEGGHMGVLLAPATRMQVARFVAHHVVGAQRAVP